MSDMSLHKALRLSCDDLNTTIIALEIMTN